MNELQSISFYDTHFEIIDHDGNRWVTVKQLAEALGYSDHKKLSTLIRRNASEFQNKIEYLNLRYSSGGKPDQIINYHGVIRAAMLSKTPVLSSSVIGQRMYFSRS